MFGWARRQRLFILLFCTFAYFYQGSDENKATRIFLTHALVDRRAADITPDAAHVIDKGRKGDRYFSDKAPFVSWLATVPYALTRAGDAIFRVPHVRATERVRVHVLAAAIGAGAGVIASFFLNATLLLLGATRRQAGLLTVGYALGTLLFPYSTVLYGHALAAALLAFSFWIVVRTDVEETFTTRDAVMLGAAWGACVVTEYPTALLCAIQAIAIAPVVFRTRKLAWVAAGGIPVLLLHSLFLKWAFGSPFALPYGFVAEPFFRARMTTGLLGLGHPTAARLYGVLLSPYRGLFFFCPFLVLGFAGFGDWLARSVHLRAAFVCGASAIVYVLFCSSYYAWDGGLSTSCRHMVPALIYFVVPMAFFLRGSRARTWIAIGALVPSVAIMLVCTAVLVQQREGPTSWMNPFYDTVVPNLLHGRLGTNWIDLDHEGPRGDASYNLGTLFGLGPAASLVFLAALWIAAYASSLFPRRAVA